MSIHLDHILVPVRGPVDMKVDMQHRGRIVYWNDPDIHQWELLTVSYARQPVSMAAR